MKDAIVIVRYGLRGYPSPKNLSVVSEVFYGLPSLVIYYFVTALSFPIPDSVSAAELLRDGRQILRKEFLRRQRESTVNSGPNIPTPAEFLEELEQRPLAYLPPSTSEKLSAFQEDIDVRKMMSRHLEDSLKVIGEFRTEHVAGVSAEHVAVAESPASVYPSLLTLVSQFRGSFLREKRGSTEREGLFSGVKTIFQSMKARKGDTSGWFSRITERLTRQIESQRGSISGRFSWVKGKFTKSSEVSATH